MQRCYHPFYPKVQYLYAQFPDNLMCCTYYKTLSINNVIRKTFYYHTKKEYSPWTEVQGHIFRWNFFIQVLFSNLIFDYIVAYKSDFINTNCAKQPIFGRYYILCRLENIILYPNNKIAPALFIPRLLLLRFLQFIWNFF